MHNTAWSTGMSIHYEVRTPSNQHGIFLKPPWLISCPEIHAQPPPKVYLDDTCFDVFMKHLGNLLGHDRGLSDLGAMPWSSTAKNLRQVMVREPSGITHGHLKQLDMIFA